MFTKKTQVETQLDAEIQASLKKLSSMPDKTVEGYGKLVEHISKLHKLKTEERSKPISADTVLVVAANIFGILWLTRYEREHVLNSKALSFINLKNK